MANVRNKVSQAVVEATYGVAGPFTAADALLTRNAKVKPLIGDVVERALDLPTYGARPTGFTNLRNGFSFEVEMAGSGAANIAAPWMKLNRACGLGAPVSSAVGGQHMEQPLISNDGASLAFNLNIDGQLHAQTGARGTFSWSVEANQIPFFSYEFIGLAPTGAVRTNVAPVTPDFTAFQTPVEASTSNTSIVLDGYQPLVRSFTGQMGNTTPFRSLIGGKLVRVTNRDISGTLVIQDPDFLKDYIAIARSRTLVPLAFQHGTVAGNIVTATAPKVELTLPEDAYSNEDDVQMLTLNWRAIITTGNDEWLWECK
jgi:hypothetical protein